MALSRKHYVAIAKVIRKAHEDDWVYSKDACNQIAVELADFFQEDNP
jgi:hypothetical protein